MVFGRAEQQTDKQKAGASNAALTRLDKALNAGAWLILVAAWLPNNLSLVGGWLVNSARRGLG